MTFPFQIRTGIGHDTHALVAGRPLILGGVVIPWSRGLAGHSDADVLLHAVTDAILGAAGLDDIGVLFPDSDPANKDRNSAEMLSVAVRKVVSCGWTVTNVDTVLFAQEPKIGPWRTAIRARLAAILSLDTDAVNIKAKTGEKLGVIGRGEAISALAIATLLRHS